MESEKDWFQCSEIFGRHYFVNIHWIVFYNSIFTTLKVKLEHQFMFKFWRMLFSEIEPQRSTLDRIEVGKTIKDCKCENQIKLLHRFSLEGSYYCFLFFFRRSGYLYMLHEDVDDVQSFHPFHCHWSGKFRMSKNGKGLFRIHWWVIVFLMETVSSPHLPAQLNT